MEREWAEGKEEINREFEPGDRFVPLLVDITFFVSAIRAYQTAKNARERRNEIQKILAVGEWYLYYEDRRTGRRDTIILEADLKHVSSKSPLTIAYRIKEGSDQAPRIVLDIASDIDAKTMIQGLRSGVYKNRLLKEILLFYKRKFYRLPKSLVMSNRIYEIIKSEKGYT
jgi:hypothetical protein